MANSSGIMTFENVRVVNAPIAVQAQASQASQGKTEGMRAYIDSTKRLRAQTVEEAKQVASERKVQKSKSARVSIARSASAKTVELTDGSQTLVGPNGEQGMPLDEDSIKRPGKARGEGDREAAQRDVPGRPPRLKPADPDRA